MAYADNVEETTTTTGTGSVTLAGAVSGYQAFSTVIPSGTQSVYYRITNGTLWEVGYGLYTNATTVLTRPAANVLSGSSGAGALITLSGTSTVSLVQPSAAIADVGVTAAFANAAVPQ
jgi:hypothetical protein